MDCFFSIIIPTYNSSKQIYNCLKSITSQTFTNYEILIIDGLSKDETCNIVSNFNDNRIRIISEKDNGIYDAMNKGVVNAKGDWLYFLGSDDELFDTDVLKNVHAQINNEFDKIVYGNVKIVNDTGWGKDGEIYAGKFDVERLFAKNISHQAIFYKKEVFKDCGFYNLDYKTCADYDYNLRAAARFELKYIDMIIANFIGGGSSTNNRDYIFEGDYHKSIIGYYYKQLYLNKFKSFEQAILKQGTSRLYQFKIFQALYLLSVGLYFKVNRLNKKIKHSISIRLPRFHLFRKS